MLPIREGRDFVRSGSLFFALAMMLLATPHFSRADSMISSMPAGGDISFFGIPNTQTYGQTITAPITGGDFLISFSFVVNLPSSLAFQGEVYAWDDVNLRATGPDLYQSAPVSTAGTGNQLVTFNVGDVQLTAGQQYVIFASSSKLNASHSGTGTFSAGQTPYGGGMFVFQNSSNTPTLWTTANWNTLTDGSTDLAFTADFSTAPAPVPLMSSAWGGVILFSGLGTIMTIRRRMASLIH
jgi:hypothetical protein